MASKSSKNILSMAQYKAVLDDSSSINEPYLEPGHLHPGKELPSSKKWFKGARDRGFRGDLAA
ncbi:hypothetical protein EV11_1735 [Prochlorococcus sp. SS52]|uniref:Uncharacterized protein n=2 Tax=Prochlorococcaceae TaxID=2881426 RepID=Q7VAE5_PROMA|nr:hypothetical protein [Prochlorococcus marinus]AAQ00563.1 Predicted protein [Prochlorococcus marinus subsp. marinus str. CCMP1375]KGG10953.1 hypothetical protein EV04_1917 [Prochlorococcus marinus str. LG]KGG31541.1 hypothetical protein EV10_1634 [Prochlorococcus marinus str. SS51]KGG34606.1 hypothetical protein EV11_1735 [Prochlorococcus sp. SS52]KGG19956.1 hypothetical protein EV08_1188 [Prochlorococcus marinus str. SS2]